MFAISKRRKMNGRVDMNNQVETIKECEPCEGTGWCGNDFDGYHPCKDCGKTGQVSIAEVTHE